MHLNDSSDAEEILNVYLHSYDGPQIKNEPAMQPREQRQARIRPNNGQRRQIELMCEENRAGVLVRDQC